MRTCIKAWMSLNFGQIPPLTTELAALERLKNRCHHLISVDIDPIFFKLAGIKDMHNIMNEFEFRPDWTTDYGVSCPWASKKYPHRLIMGKMVFPLFLCCFWLDPFDTFMLQEQALKLGWVRIFWNEIWPWHIGLRWAIVALWVTCSETIVIYDLKLATDDWSDKTFLLTSKLCPLGEVCPLPRGYIHVLNHKKKLYKIRLQRDFFETCNKWVKW